MVQRCGEPHGIIKYIEALVVASRSLTAAGEDVVVAAISGQRVNRPRRFDYVVQDWRAAGLLMPSVVRAGRSSPCNGT